MLPARSIKSLIFFASACVCANAGCTTPPDLDAVQQYAATTADAESSFALIAADFEASCLRRHDAFLLLPSNLDRRELRHTQLQLAPGYRTSAEAPEPVVTPLPVPNGYVDDANCSKSGVSDEWARHNAIVLAYVRELGAIAAVDAVPTFAPAPLESPLVSANVISSAQFDAFSALASTISNLVITGDQRAEIANLTHATNGPLHDAVGALRLVDAAYAQELKLEYGETEGVYEVLIDQELQARVKAEPADRFLLSSEIAQQRATENRTLLAINARRLSTLDYAHVLDAIAQTHQDLVDASNKKASLADYVNIFKSTVVPLHSTIEALRAAVK